MRTILGAAAVMLAAAQAFAAGADRDADGKVSREELVMMHASLFEQLDANGDGVVAGDEADPSFLEMADQDKDGKVTTDENDAYATDAAARDLQQCDVNGDDTLSGDEIACITASDSSQE